MAEKAIFSKGGQGKPYIDLFHGQNHNQENGSESVYDNLDFTAVNQNGNNSDRENVHKLKCLEKIYTRQKIVTAVVVCLLVAVAVAVAVYYLTGKPEEKDEQPMKGEISRPDTSTMATSHTSTVATTYIFTMATTDTSEMAKTDTSKMATTETSTMATKSSTFLLSTIDEGMTSKEMKTQSTTPEDISIGLSEWGKWSPCTVSCGSGTQRRYKRCKDYTGICTGEYLQTSVCQMQTCPVYGRWTTWLSWFPCDVTCGGGQQARKRVCEKKIDSDLDCIGKSLQIQNCSTWNCPDCSKTCAVGRLSENCDACICETNIIEGRVTSLETGAGLFEAEILDAELPIKVLARTDKDGHFTLQAVCTTSKLLVRRTSFVEIITEANNSYIEISLTKIVYPYFIETPQSKSRLIGENVTLCCVAKASPPVTSYEWFQNSVVLNESLYPEGTHLHLRVLNQSDSGEYKCRANSPSGAMISSIATLQVHDEADGFCLASRLQKTVILPSGCEIDLVDVGKCSAIGCRQTGRNESGSCRERTRSCCRATETRLETIKCSGNDQYVFVVTSCGCRPCDIKGLTVAGKAVSFNNGTPVKYAEVWVNGDLTTKTNGIGEFKFSPSLDTDEIVVTVKDVKSKEFTDAIKVIHLTDDMSGTVDVVIRMFKITVYSEMNSTVKNTVVAGTLATNLSISRAEFTVPANSFMHQNGTLYNGTVCFCMTFLDPTNVSSLQDIPGEFRTLNAEGEQETLASFGLFNIKFEDRSGNELNSNEVIDVSIPYNVGENVLSKDMKLWTLNFMGEWEEIISSENLKRRKRQVQSAQWIGGINLAEINREWINLDYRNVFSTSDYSCFYKIRVYQSDSLVSEIMNPYYGITVDFHSYDGNVLKSYYNNVIINDPSNICFPGLCNNTYWFINVFYRVNDNFGAKQNLSFGNISTSQFSDYEITNNNAVMKINMTLQSNSPFYRIKTDCDKSGKNENHLRVYFGKLARNYVTLERCNYEEDCNDENKKCLLAWYPNLARSQGDEAYGVCFVKIRVEFAPGKSAYHHNTKLKASSYLGKFLSGARLGFLEYELTKDTDGSLVNTTLCLQYKCSGNLEPGTCDSSTVYLDNTKVHISVDVPEALMQCAVKTESAYLREQSKKLNDSYTSQIGSSDFVFHAPHEGGSQYGLYIKRDFSSVEVPAFGTDFEKASSNLYGYCKAGRIYHTTNDHIGLAATFLCK